MLKEQYVSGGKNSSPVVQGDIEPFISPIDKRVISSRSHLRAHNAEHGVTDSRDYSHDFMLKRSGQRIAEMTGQTRAAKQERREIIIRELSKHDR